MKDTTITALATYPAESAIGVIRVSGRDTFRIVSSVFSPSRRDFKSVKPNFSVHGRIHSKDEIIDEAMLVLFKSPLSYTGEDMAEISFHGNPFIAGRITELLISKGCVPAGPGEFTKRAFLNGKMDLSRAEAVADLISAKDNASHKLALNQLSGGESALIKKLRSGLLGLLSLIEAEIDFAHEDIHKTTPAAAAGLAENILEEIRGLLKNADEGMMLKNGIKTAIAGKPNTGKSSLLNALLKKNRAIVTKTPGTTRDTIEGSLFTGGLHFRLTDTAGLRKAANLAESHGIKRTQSAIKTADMVIFVLDASKKPDKSDLVVFRMIKSKTAVIALNKSDLKTAVTPAEARKYLGLGPETAVTPVSAKTKYGIKNLTNLLKNIIISAHKDIVRETLITSLRHKKALESSAVNISSAVKALKKGAFEEAAFDLKQASGRIASITGEISSEDILEKIFKNFCIGK